MSSLLPLVTKYIYAIGGHILMGLGLVSCVLSLIAFNKKIVRKNPCSIYLTAYHMTNFLIISTALVFNILVGGYNISFNTYNLFVCRFCMYLTLTLSILSPSYLILGSIDRVLITSSNTSTRQRSTRRLAYLSIILVTLFWAIAHSHTYITVSIYQYVPHYYVCYITPGIYLTIFAYYSWIIIALVIPLLFVILGLWTLKNLRNRRRPMANHASNTCHQQLIHSKDRQFVQILLIDTSVYITCTLMLSIVLIYQQITQYNDKNALQYQIELFLQYTAYMMTFTPYCISLYTNCIGSKTFRKEIQMIICCK